MNLLIGLFSNLCFSMEQGESEPIQQTNLEEEGEEAELTKASFEEQQVGLENDQKPNINKRVLQLQKTNRIGSVDHFSSEFNQFVYDRDVSIERAQQIKQCPYLNVSQIKEAMAEIDLKIDELKRLEDLIFSPYYPSHENTSHKKKKHAEHVDRPKKLNFRSIKRKVKKVDPENNEQQIFLIRELLKKENTKNLKIKKREKLCERISELSIYIPDYIATLDKKIKTAQNQIEQQPSNKLKLLIIKKANQEKQN